VSGGFVADSSVAISWVALSQSTKVTDRLLDDVASGTPFIVPVLWMFEVANSLLVLMRRKRIDQEECSRARSILSRLMPVVDDEGPRLALGQITDLAQKHELSVYDAAYLELAIRKRLPLASRDASLNKAAKLAGVKTLV
jgi:predicted nucleic acid-binding protein